MSTQELNLIPVPFYGDTILAVETEDGLFVALKPICERLGIGWQGQHRKLSNQGRPWGMVHLMIPSAGGPQETTCLPVHLLAAWLFTVHPSKVNPEIRDSLIRYQTEAADVLDRHFRQKTRDMDARLVKLERQHRQMASIVLAFNPLWGRIAHLLQAGVHRGQVWRVVNRPEILIWQAIEEMERLGVIDREDWRPSMFGVFDGPSAETIAKAKKRAKQGASIQPTLDLDGPTAGEG